VAAIEDDREREQRGRQARAAVLGRFSWSSITAALVDVIAEVLVEPPSQASPQAPAGAIVHDRM